MYVEEAEWAIEVMKATGLPVAMCLNICSAGDFEGVSVEECAVRIAKAGKWWNPCFIFLFLCHCCLIFTRKIWLAVLCFNSIITLF